MGFAHRLPAHSSETSETAGNKTRRLQIIALAVAFLLLFHPGAPAAEPLVRRPILSVAKTAKSDLHNALEAIPLDKLKPEDRGKVESVLSNLSVFRRMPLKVIDCDPDMYLFLVRHPDVVVNIWRLLEISQLRMEQVGRRRFTLSEPVGATVSLEYVHRSHDTHVVYGEGTYRGPLLSRPVSGRGVLVLKTGYVRETNGRYYITNRLDCFLNVEPLGAELLTKTVSPLMGRTADNNFVLTAAFLARLSRTAELGGGGIRALAAKLDRVRPEVRTEFVEMARKVNEKSALASRPRITR